MGDANLPREEEPNSNNNAASVPSSVTARTNVSEMSAFNEEDEDFNNENEYSNNNSAYAEFGAVFNPTFQSDFFLADGSRAHFNEVAAEVIAEHPEWNLQSVEGNPLAYEPGGDNPSRYYLAWVTANVGVEPPGLFAVWPQFAAVMEERIPGLGLPADLQPLTGWRPPAPLTPGLQAMINMVRTRGYGGGGGGGGGYRGGRRRLTRKRKALKRRSKTRSKKSRRSRT